MMLSDAEVEWLKSISLTTASAGVWLLYKSHLEGAQMDGNLNVQQSAPQAGKPKAKGGSGYQRETAEEKEARAAAEARRKREVRYANYSRWVLERQQAECSDEWQFKNKIATTYNTVEEWLRHGDDHPKLSHSMADWPERQALAVRHPDLTDEMIAAAIQRGKDERAAHAEAEKSREAKLRASRVATVRPGYPVQLRKVSEFTLIELGLAKTPEEWTDELIDEAVEMAFHGGEEFKAWKNENAEMLAAMREKYRLGGSQ